MLVFCMDQLHNTHFLTDFPSNKVVEQEFLARRMEKLFGVDHRAGRRLHARHDECWCCCSFAAVLDSIVYKFGSILSLSRD